jgi:hypothetical protein
MEANEVIHMERDWSPLRAAGLAAADGVLIWQLWPDLTALRHDLAAPQAWVTRVGADAAGGQLVAGLLWLVALSLAVGLAAALLGYLPGAAGAAGRRWAAIALPRMLYRAAVGAAGLGVLLTPVAAGALPTHPTAGPLPTPGWPTSTVPAPRMPTSPSTASPPAEPRPAPTPHEAEPDASDLVVVRAGDSLWRIAAAHLPPRTSEQRIAAMWPRWYAANRTLIGADPRRILPGQHLHAPTDQERP